MTTAHVCLICFAAVSLVAAAAGLLLRDVAASLAGSREEGRIGRLTVVRQPRSNSPISRFDHWFRWLVLETGAGGAPLTVLLVMVLCGLAVGGGAWILQDDPVSAAFLAAAGTLLPLPLLMRARRKRLGKMQEQLPGVLDLLARAVRAGESVDHAIALAGARGPEPLAREFRRTAGQLEMGLSVSAAMRSLGARVRLQDMRIFTAAVAVHREAGGNLAHTLERMSQVVRERLAYRRQLRAVTAAGRFSASMVSLAGPFLFAYMFVFQRDYVGRLLDQPLGQMMLAAAVLLELAGLVWVAQMLKSE